MPAQVLNDMESFIINRDKELRNELHRLLSDLGEELVEDHNKVVKPWKHKPKFQYRVYTHPGEVGIEVFPMGRYKLIWHYVDRGTRPHLIQPKKKGGVLVFQTGYIPRTRPIARMVSGGGKYTGGFRAAKLVLHPGSKGRKFTDKFRRDLRPELARVLRLAFRRAWRRRG